MELTNYLATGLLLFAAGTVLARGQDAYGALLAGGREGLKTVVSILPALVMLLTGVELLRASGAMAALIRLISPAARLVGIPAEVVPLMLVRPFSGSAALAVGAEIMSAHGPDSLIGRTAAVMLGSTETTFYTISVYFGAAGIKKTRYAVPAAVIADLAGFVAAAVTAKALGR